MPKLIQVLIFEETGNFAEQLLSALDQWGFEPHWRRVETQGEYVAALRPDLDIILLTRDSELFSLAMALQPLKDMGFDIPVIVIGNVQDDAGMLCIKQGAADFVRHDGLGRLGFAVTRSMELRRLQAETYLALKEAETKEAEFEKQKQRLDNLLSTIPGVFWEAWGKPDDRAQQINFVSSYVETLLGYTVEEWLSSPNFWLSIVHPDDRAQAAQRAVEIFGGSDYRENAFRWIAKDGREVWVESRSAVIHDTTGKPIGMRGVNIDITQRKKIEAAAHQHKELLQTIFDHIPIMITCREPNGRLRLVNREWERVLGWSLQEAQSRNIDAELYPDPVEHNRVKAFIRQADGIKGDFRTRSRNGKTLYTRWTTLRLSDGSTIGLGRDVSERKIASDAIERLATEMRLLLKSTSEGIYGIDVEGRCTFINPAGAQMIGYSPAEVHGKDMHALLHYQHGDGSLSPTAECPMSRALRMNERCHVDTEEFRRKDGTTFPVEFWATPIIENGVARGAVITFSDITQRKEGERQIREQARLLDLAHDAISVRDLHDRIQFWNCGAERLFGWQAEEIVGADVKEILCANPSTYAAAQATVLKKGEWQGEMTLRSKHGREIIVGSRWTLVRDEMERPKSVLEIQTDITEQKNLETRFLRSQRLESIGTLASGVAHDLNNILSPILISAPLLREPLPPDTFEMLVATIEVSAQRGSDIVKQVLTFARGIEGERVPLQLKHLVREMDQIAVETFPKNVTIHTRLAPDLPAVEGDATQLHQVLLNLCINARDAMPSGGTLTITGESLDVDENYAAMLPDAKVGRYVQLAVSDTGSGIPRNILDKIFDPFFTTKEPGKGTGLGLSTVIGIVKSHGGFLSVHSEVGRGTTFKIFIPVASGELAQAGRSEEVSEFPGDGERILIVDDESGLRRVLETLLRKNGYEVISAPDGVEALAIFAQQPQEIRVVLTDVMMPLLDGVSLSRALRRLNPHIRIIASTGQGEELRRNELETLGIETFLIKPYSAPTLLKTLREALNIAS